MAYQTFVERELSTCDVNNGNKSYPSIIVSFFENQPFLEGRCSLDGLVVNKHGDSEAA